MTILCRPPARESIRILHCDDSESYRALVREMLRPHTGVEIVAQAAGHGAAVTQAAVVQPDLVLLDLDAHRDEQVLARLRDVCSARILVLSGDPDLAEDPLVMQADGFVSKSAGMGRVIQAVLTAVPSGWLLGSVS